MRRQLGIAPVVIPSPDPVSIAIDVAVGLVALVGFFQARKHARQAEENEVVEVQNKLGTDMDVISEAAQQSTDVDELVRLHDQLSTLGQDFYNYTLGFSIAGPGARETIFGDEVSPGVFHTTPAHPGWLTKLIDFIKTKIGELTGMQPQLGFDWEKLIGIGANVAANIFGRDGSTTTTTTTTPTTTTSTPAAAMPSWVLPAVLIGGALLLMKK